MQSGKCGYQAQCLILPSHSSATMSASGSPSLTRPGDKLPLLFVGLSNESYQGTALGGKQSLPSFHAGLLVLWINYLIPFYMCL